MCLEGKNFSSTLLVLFLRTCKVNWQRQINTRKKHKILLLFSVHRHSQKRSETQGVVRFKGLYCNSNKNREFGPWGMINCIEVTWKYTVKNKSYFSKGCSCRFISVPALVVRVTLPGVGEGVPSHGKLMPCF